MFEPNKELKSLKGTGDLIVNNKKIPIIFSVQQTYDGKIRGNMEINEDNSAQYLKYITMKHYVGSHIMPGYTIIGTAEDNSSIKINGIAITSYNFTSNKEVSFLKNIKFSALEMINDHENYSKGDNVSLIFGITNLQTINNQIKTDFGKITFFPIENIDEQEKTIREISRTGYPCVTAVINVEPSELSIFQNLDDLTNHIVGKLYDLLTVSSFSQGLYQDWVYLDVYRKEDEKENLYEKMRSPKSKSSRREMIIPYMSNQKYLETSYERYSKIKNKTGLDIAIEWYIEGLSGDVIENSYVMFYTALECLIYRYALKHKKEFIFSDAEEWREFENKAKEKIKEILIDMDKGSEERASVYSSLKGLRRRSFNELLKNFLNEYEIGYTDLVKDLGKPKGIRNDIIHKGQAYAPFEETVKNLDSIKALLQRAILSLLCCDGINTNERQGISNPFNRNPKDDFKN